MSDTPRTDKQWPGHKSCNIEWAKELEREADGLRLELAEANEKLAKLAAALRANTVASQKDCACLSCQTARKALEEAGV